MLELRPTCEQCNKALPPGSLEARICSYECTFCADCVETQLHNVCPNCGGGFEKRPIRPKTERRPGVSLGQRPASTQRRHIRYDHAAIAAFSAKVRDIPPAER